MTAKTFRASDIKTHQYSSSILGSGTYGQVHYCFTEGNQAKAVKLLVLTGSQTALRDGRAQAEAEIKALQTTETSLFTVQFYGTVDFEQQQWIGVIMEYMPRGNLDDLLRRKTEVPLRLRYRILYDVARGLEHLHTAKYDRRISHNDMKPENVLLDEGYRAKLCDFGASDFAAKTSATIQEQTTPHRIHTPCYAAPEFLLDRESRRTRAMDVFSYALVTYFTLTGKDPFKIRHEEETMSSMYSKNRDERPILKDMRHPFASKSVEDQKLLDTLIDNMVNCWATDPEERREITDVRKDLKRYYDKYKSDIEETISRLAESDPVKNKHRKDEELITLEQLCREIRYGVKPSDCSKIDVSEQNAVKTIRRIHIDEELDENEEFELQTRNMVFRCAVKERINIKTTSSKKSNDSPAMKATYDMTSEEEKT